MKIIIVLAFVLLSACMPAKKTESWEVNELFTQLSELRKEIGILKVDVKGLKQRAIKKTRNSKQAEIDLRHSFPMGKETAKYAIVEFTDYQCPFCLKHRKKTFPLIKQQYIDTGKIKYFVKDFPLDFHSQAKNASISSLCAGQQGSFWEMHELIFDNNRKLSEELFLQFAVQIKLDVSNFKKCLTSAEAKRVVDNNISEGELIGVRGTPAFFVGKIQDNKLVDIRALYGVQSFSSFSRVINTLMQK